MNQVGSGEVTGMKNHFRGLFDLSDDLQSRLKEYREGLGENRLPEVAFISEPPSLDGDIQKVGEYLARVNYAVPNYRDNGNPVGAYYFLSSLLQELITIKDIHKSPDFLRFIGEWIGAASQSGDYLSVKKQIPKITSLIEYHTNIVTSGKDVFADNLDISDDNIFIYRDKLLNIIVNLAFFYSHIGEYTELSRLTKIGSRIATLFGSAQIKFDIIVLELGTLLTLGESGSTKLDTLLKEAHTGTVILEEVYSEKAEYAVYNERNKNQLAVLELFLTMKRANLSDISQIADIFRKRDELFEHKTIDDPKRQRLIHMEIILYIAFKDFQKNTTNLVEFINDKNEDFQYLTDRCNLIDSEGYDLTAYLDKPNARLFLAPLIELFKFNIREMFTKRHPGMKEQNKALELMTTIYRLAVGVGAGNRNENRTIFKKLSFFKSFIRNSKLLMLSDEDQSSVTSEDLILKLIEDEIAKQEVLAKGNYEILCNNILKKWKGVMQIASISVSTYIDGKEYDPINVINNTIKPVNYLHTIDQNFQGKNYRFTIVVNDVGIQPDQLETLSHDVFFLLPHIQRENTEKKLDQTLTKLNHDFVNLIPNAATLSTLVSESLGGVRIKVSGLLMSGELNANDGKILESIGTQLATLQRFMDLVVGNLREASGFSKRVRHEVTGVMSGKNSSDLDTEEISIEDFLREKSSNDSYSDKIDTQFDIKSPNMIIPMNRDYFSALFLNIRQNVFRYKKLEQEKGIMKITITENQDSQIIMFKDFGIGMDQATIDAYLSGNCTPSEHADSHGLGSQNVVDIVKKHGWKLVIESNLGNNHGQPTYTNILISIPKK